MLVDQTWRWMSINWQTPDFVFIEICSNSYLWPFVLLGTVSYSSYFYSLKIYAFLLGQATKGSHVQLHTTIVQRVSIYCLNFVLLAGPKSLHYAVLLINWKLIQIVICNFVMVDLILTECEQAFAIFMNHHEVILKTTYCSSW